jgi:hypothetical protein
MLPIAAGIIFAVLILANADAIIALIGFAVLIVYRPLGRRRCRAVGRP